MGGRSPLPEPFGAWRRYAQTALHAGAALPGGRRTQTADGAICGMEMAARKPWTGRAPRYCSARK